MPRSNSSKPCPHGPSPEECAVCALGEDERDYGYDGSTQPRPFIIKKGTIKRIHVDKNVIASNRKHHRNDPPITI